MTVICYTSATIFLIYFSSLTAQSVKGRLEIVPPFPGQPVVIEGEKVRIPCAAQDLQHRGTKPHKITFYEASRFGDLQEIKAGDDYSHYTFETKFEMNGSRLISHLVINNVTVALQGRYECHAAQSTIQQSKGEQPAKYGFSIVVVPKRRLPNLNYSKSLTTEFDKPASLFCRLVTAIIDSNAVKLDKIAWYKNDLPTGWEISNLENEKLPNINLTMNSSADGGTYKCKLFTTLGSKRKYNITGLVNVYIQLKIARGTTTLKGLESRDVVMECPADAYPLNVTWMRVNNEGQRHQLASNERYLITRPCESCRYRMTIKNLQPRDFGHYICVATSNMESGIHHFRLVRGALEIVPPFPGHPVVIEGEKVRIPCAAQDLENKTMPHNMTFYKVMNRYGDLSPPLPTNENFTFETNFDMNGWRITTYLVINNMTEALKGRYECHAARPQDNSGRVVAAKYGFSIVYIPKDDLPSLNHSKSVTTEFGKPASLYCQLVPAKVQVSSNIVKLDKIAWFKNNLITDREQTALQDKLPNINLTMNSPTDGGTYTCRLFTTLGLTRQYNITGIVEVLIKPQFQAISAGSVGDDGNEKTLDDNEIIRMKGESAKFECLAKGNPISIIWKKKPRDSDKTEVLDKKANGTMHYQFSDDTNRFEGFFMEIKEVDFNDRGQYKCCVEQSNPNATELCQTFTLRVKDPKGWLWPLIGIIIMAVLIVLILVITSLYKEKIASTQRSEVVPQTDLSYTQTEYGGRGHIRLRTTGRTG